jgi:hypothetical protein
MLHIRLVLTLVLALVAASVHAATARAGTYTVRTCWDGQPDGWSAVGNNAWQNAEAWTNCPATTGEGLYSSILSLPGIWPNGTMVGHTFTAPPGTTVTGFLADVESWVSPYITRWWSRGLFDADTGRLIAAIPVTSTRHDQPIYAAFLTKNIAARRLFVGLRCTDPECPIEGPAPGLVEVIYFLFRQRVAVRKVTLTIDDPVSPEVAVTQAPPAGWPAGAAYPVTFTASDNVGVRSMAIFIDGIAVERRNPGCYDPVGNTVARPCANSAANISGSIDTHTLTEGRHEVRIEAMDAANNVSERGYSLYVDRTPPLGPRGLRVRPGDGWQRDNRFSVAWTNPSEGAVAPIDAAAYEVCPDGNAPFDDSGCVRGFRTGSEISGIDDLAVPGDGVWRVRIALRDAAGNSDPERSADFGGLRLDTEPPVATFLPFDVNSPTSVRLSATDRTSGIERVDIEARRQGETVWRSLPVEPTGAGATAEINDDEWQDGTYELRAHVVDRAGNERTTTTLGDGSTLAVTLPVRAPSALAVGHSERVRVKSSRGKPRYRRVLVARPSARFGQPVTLNGTLRDLAGNPRAGAAVSVLERVDLPGMPWKIIAVLPTDAAGAFEYRALPGPARRLRFRYTGSATARSTEEEVELRVRAGSTLAPDRRHARNGDSVVFKGRLLGLPLPSGGKLLALQAQTRRGWRTFATPRAREQDGRWTYRYRFTGTLTTARYAFRLVVPSESGYPYAQGISPVATVLVRGA